MKAAATSRDVTNVIGETIKICAIGAPTFAEDKRAAYLFKRLKQAGVLHLRRDAAGNVIGELGKKGASPCVLVSAHLDTVFPAGTKLKPERGGGRLYGPGIGDNSVSLAALLWLAETLKKNGLPEKGRVIFAANTGEEGLGNLHGMRTLIKRYRKEVNLVLPIEGHFRDTPCNEGVASVRLQAEVTAAGGHSWHDFGNPSAIHALGEMVSRISKIKVPRSPKTTFNVGLISGGRSVNTIADHARLIIDMRSVDKSALQKLEQRVRKVIDECCRQGVRVRIKEAGRRPGGAIPASHPLCRVHEAARQTLGLKKAEFIAASTDANIPLSEGIPALCVGITSGKFMHSEDEYIETAPIRAGLDLLLLQTLGCLELS